MSALRQRGHLQVTTAPKAESEKAMHKITVIIYLILNNFTSSFIQHFETHTIITGITDNSTGAECTKV